MVHPGRRPLLLLDGRRVRGDWELHPPSLAGAVQELKMSSHTVYVAATITQSRTGRWIFRARTLDRDPREAKAMYEAAVRPLLAPHWRD